MAERAEKSLIHRRPAPEAASVASWQMSLREAMFEALDADSVRDIVRGLVAKAKGGDLAAARLVLNYAVGGATVNVKNAVINNHAPLPTPPSQGPPGSSLRMTDMAERAARGLPLRDPRDRGHGEAD